jgi:hypothetical protein
LAAPVERASKNFENSSARGISEPVGYENPSVSAWLSALRSMDRLAARRTRMSCHGDFGSHWSGRSSQKVPCDSLGATSLNPGVRWMSSATGPVSRYAMSTSPFLSAAARVVSSGRLR